MSKLRSGLRHWCQETKGAVMVEFAVVCLVFLLIVAGIIDLGLAFYVRQVVTNASREGARYGVVYVTDASGNRVAPINFSAANTPPRTSITSYVLNNYLSNSYLPAGSNPQVPTPTGAGYTSGNMGDPLQVTVRATYNWIMLGHFIPSLGSSTNISATTVMQLE
jgi:Flp pilus assembly protein TadG